MFRKYGTATAWTALGVLLVSAGAAFGQAQMQCYGGDPQMLIKTQPIYTGAAPQYVQSSYSGRWSEYEPFATKARWSEMSRIPSTVQLASAQPGTWYVPAASAPGQPPQVYVPVVVQAQPQPQTQPMAPQAQSGYVRPLHTEAFPQQQQQVAAMPPSGASYPATNPDATTPPGAVGCSGERIDATTAEATRRQFEAVGFQNVRDLRKGCDNVWHAHARLNNRATYVMLNPQGDIYIEKNP